VPAPEPVDALAVSEWRVGDEVRPVAALYQSGRPARITLPPTSRSFSLEFSALYFSAPQRARYAHRLIRLEDAWIETDATRREVAYSHLPPGDYMLELRAAGPDGRWLDPPTRIQVLVEAAWYQTTAFRLAIGAVVLAALWAGVRMRTAWLLRRQRELQQLVDERTAALKASEARMARMAFYDTLTGLPNRRMLSQRHELALAHARRHQRGFTLLQVDLDRFKQINDSLGHAAGDVLLVAAAQRMQEAVRETDLVARIGGDEFAILLEDTDQWAELEQVCQRIIRSFEEPVRFGEVDMKTSPSIGAATYPAHGQTLDQLLAKADQALYEAKGAGRNTWRMAPPAST
jgi:diguanylate cyclase (GGDEF)-like protein